MIKGSTLAGFGELVGRSGVDARWLLASAGLSEIYLRQPEMYLPFYNFVKLLELAAKETGRPLFATELGFHQGVGVFGSIASSLVTSATIGVALERILEHYMLQTTGVQLYLDRLGRTAVWSAVITAPVPSCARQIHAHLCGDGIAIMRAFAGPDWMPEEVHLAHPAPEAGIGQYYQYFGESVRFDAIRTALVFDAEILNVPLPDADPALHELIQRQLAQRALRFVEDLPVQVEATIQNEMPTGSVSLEAVARALAMSPRSLQRHLNGSGISFTEVLDGARRKTAEHYLLNSNLPLTEVSALLGFQTLSNFSHAFRRWHQASPRQWRQSQPRGAGLASWSD